MKFNLAPVFAGQASYADIVRDTTQNDLYQSTNELFDELTAILAQVSDATVTFVPRDPSATDKSEEGWTIGHVVAHLTATLEETAAFAAMLARGVTVEGRLRFETDWQQLSTLALVQARLRESQRICRSFLGAWPDEPHFDLTRTVIPALGPLNAIGVSILGLSHGQGHVEQIRNVLEQYTHAHSL